MSMSEKEIQELYKFWDESPEIRQEIFGMKRKRPWYRLLWTKVMVYFSSLRG
jgi:hypothetical protein